MGHGEAGVVGAQGQGSQAVDLAEGAGQGGCRTAGPRANEGTKASTVPGNQ